MLLFALMTVLAAADGEHPSIGEGSVSAPTVIPIGPLSGKEVCRNFDPPLEVRCAY